MDVGGLSQVVRIIFTSNSKDALSNVHENCGPSPVSNDHILDTGNLICHAPLEAMMLFAWVTCMSISMREAGLGTARTREQRRLFLGKDTSSPFIWP